MPLVERALQVLERRAVQPQLGLLKSTMLQLDSAFNERAYGASSFSDFVEKLKRADLVQVSGTGGRYIIERKGSSQPERPALKPEDLLPPLRDVLENHRLEIENGCPVEDLAGWFKTEQPNFDISAYGFQAFSEFLNYAQDKTVVRMEPHEEQGVMMVYAGRGVLSAGRSRRRRSRLPRRGGRRRGIRAAALRGGPADHLRAQSSAAQAQARRSPAQARFQAARAVVAEADAPAAPQKARGHVTPRVAY